MPTPVSAARQCLTDEAARALDDAVAVARRRSHAQTTSLHAVSALLSLPSAALRDACRRAARNPLSHPPRLQFRALELSVGVSLDRLPTAAKSSSAAASSGEDGPPISNSLMAAIKRSQANQRRNPESFHFMILHQQQQQQNQPINQTASFLKVELKHFILSILDDPIVSRVFGEAGFRSYDIKLALLQPPPLQNNSNRFLHSKMNRPVFLCNFEPGGPGLGLPFIGPDHSCRRIVEILGRKEKRNPLLMGVYAKGALKSFVESVQKGRIGILPGLSVVCVEKEIDEFVSGAMSEEKIGLRFEEVEKCVGGAGVVVSFGEVEVLVRDGNSVGAVGFVVERLGRLLEKGCGKKAVWLVGVAGSSEVYSKFLGLFPTVDRDWDLHLLTVTSSSSTSVAPSSLMGSFVPFGGFFPTPSEFRSPTNCTNTPSSTRCCDTCNEKYEQEVAETLKVPAPGCYSTSLPWLQKVNNNVGTDHRGLLDVAKTNEESTSSNAKIFGLQRKWSDICQRVHRNRSLPEFDISPTRSQASSSPLEGFQFGSGFKKPTSTSSKGLISLNEIQCSSQTSLQIVPISSSLTPVTTDLGLGTIYTSNSIVSDSLSTDGTTHQIAISSPCSAPNFEARFDSVDFKALYKFLAEKVGWQDEAIYAINRAISQCRSGAGRRRGGSRVRAGVWLAFLGPDRVGKRKIASAIAECLLGNRESLISVDLSSQDGFYPSNSIFEFHSHYCNDVLRRKTVVDYIAGELSKKPRSVVLLENVEEADFLVQNSLFQAIRTGRFPYSLGREISISNAIFVVSSAAAGRNGSLVPEKVPKIFPEERILEAKRCQMQLSLGQASDDPAERIGSTNVKVVALRKVQGTSKPTFLNKRRLVQSGSSKERGEKCKTQKLDLNIPFEEVEECDTNYNDCENSEAWLHDFCDQVDGEVAFKPFDFDCLAEQVTKSIGMQFQRAFGSDSVLEIEYDVMAQILAAAWLSDKRNAVEDWVEHVLGRSFAEAQAQQKYHHTGVQYVMKLVKCESNFVEEQEAHGVCLPARINLN